MLVRDVTRFTAHNLCHAVKSLSVVCRLSPAQVCCSVLQCVAVRCSALQCIAVCCNALQCVALRCNILQRVDRREHISSVPPVSL